MTGTTNTHRGHDRPRRRPRWTVALVLGALAVGAIGCGSGSSSTGSSGSVTTGAGGAANPTTASGEGAGGGPSPGASTGSPAVTSSTASIPGGKVVTATGTLSNVRRSPDQKLKYCAYLTTPDGSYALEFTERQYLVISNLEPIQLEIKDAKTRADVAGLGDTVTVTGVSHPDPTPLGGQSYRCDGATAYLTVTNLAPAG